MKQRGQDILRFGEFELDPANGTLARNGEPVRLSPQPLKALIFLARHPGQLVTRDQLRDAIWQDGTVVDFEHGLNTCIRQIRAALDDDAAGARILETVPKLGFRFKAPISRPPRWQPLAVGALAALVLAVAGLISLSRVERRPDETPRWPTPSAEAYALYVRGRSALDERWSHDKGSALALFQRAIAIDPAFPAAHAGLADAYRAEGWIGTVGPREAYRAGRVAAERSLALNPLAQEGHLALANLDLFLGRDWQGAERHFRRAIALAPNNATAHADYSVMLMFLAREAESMTEARLAETIDPLSARAAYSVEAAQFYARRFAECLETARHVLAIDPRFAMAYHTKGQCCTSLGRIDEAVAAYEQSGRRSGNLGHALAIGGRREEAARVLAELSATHAVHGGGVIAMEIAQVYIGLGKADLAFEWLSRADAEGGFLGTLKVAPVWDPLRGDPRFAVLLRSVGLN
jgi:DNA-binding winged helix-turn-helix (wHTH) protein/Flp pilus assembly protein TadD